MAFSLRPVPGQQTSSEQSLHIQGYEPDRGKALSLRGGGIEATLNSSPARQDGALSERQIESLASRLPPCRDRALPLSLPGSPLPDFIGENGTDPVSPVLTSAPGLFVRRLTLPAKTGKSPRPRLHPVLQDIEQQETGLIPQMSLQTGRLSEQLSQPTSPVRENFVAPETSIAVDASLADAVQTSPLHAAAPAPASAGSLLLYRQPNFSVYTVARPGQSVHPLRKPSGYTLKIPQVMPHQRERVAISQTRRIPRVDVQEMQYTATLAVPLWLEIMALLLLLAGVCWLHAYNLFQFPAYSMDEGTYMQNAWAITVGKLSPYPYGYGHPPAGWIQIALWIKLSGLFRFGSAINSGRVLMLAYATGDALLSYLIAQRLSGSKSTALLALALCAFSPLSVILQREVLLDNLATFWLLLALYLIVVSRSRLLYLTGAALALGLAILSKEVLAVCLPAMIYAVWLHITPFQRKFALVTFIYITLAMLSTFVLLALLKGELFPYAWHLPWDHHPHLSLLDTYVGQLQRGQNQGSLLDSWQIWVREDAPLLLAGVAAPAFNLLYGWRERKHLLLALLALSYWLLLVRGGVVYNFYLIPLIPLLALNIALALHVLFGWLSNFLRLVSVRALLLLLLLSLLLPYNIIGTARQVSAQPVAAQVQALTWVRAHLPHNASIVIDAYMYLDLRQPGDDGTGNATSFPRAEVYWNVATDPALRDGVFHGDWNTIDYLVVDEQMLNDMQNNGPTFSLLQEALAHANLLASFHTSDQLERVSIEIYQVRHESAPLVSGPSGRCEQAQPRCESEVLR